MPRILVTPEHLYTLGRKIKQDARQVKEIGSRVKNLQSSLDWETRQQAGVEGRINEACCNAQMLALQADEMANFLTAHAQAFEEADRQGAQNLDVVFKNGLTTDSPTSKIPSITEIFEVFKAALSTLVLASKNTGLGAVSVIVGGVDFFAVKMPKAEQALHRWEEYNRLENLDNFDITTAHIYEGEAKKALEDLGISGIKDTLDAMVNKLPKTTDIQHAMEKIYESLGTIEAWISTLK